MKWTIRDSVDVNKRAVERQYGPLMVPGDSDAQVWRVSVFDGELPLDLTGETVQAFFDLPSGETVVVEGSTAGQLINVVIPRDVCLVPGVVRGLLCLGDRVTVQDAPSSAVLVGWFTVSQGPGSVLVDPETEFSDITTLSQRVDSLESTILDLLYPVGSIYLSVSSTDPATLFPGTTWARIKDTFLLAAGDTYAAGATGGEAEHTLTVNEMPAHNHTDTVYANSVTTTGDIGYMQPTSQNNYINYRNLTTAGGGQAHNNMPPYLAVYVWQRTA